MKADFPSFENKVKQNFSLAPHTSWRIGGPAEYFLSVQNEQELQCLLEITKAQGLPLFILGSGSNLLIDDTGLPGLTLSLSGDFKKIEWLEKHVAAGAGYPMPALAKETASKGIAGFEHLIGIPGTIGAGVVINAAKGTDNARSMKSILDSVCYIDEGLDLVETGLECLELGYRTSYLKGKRALVINAHFHIHTRIDPEEIKKNMRAILDERKTKFPLDLPNCGSVFKKPPGAPPAGRLIETAGLKGLRFGDAQISLRHANFIVNLGHASSSDVKTLINKVVETVQKVHGLTLEREVIFWPEENLWNQW